MTTVWVDPNKPIDVALRIFKKKLGMDGTMAELRKREFYTKPSVAKKQKNIEARQKAKKKEKDR